MKNHVFCILPLALLLIVGTPALGQEPVGIFDDFTDIGEPIIPGLTEMDGERYRVDAVGESLGYRTFEDECHFVYMEMSGNFAIGADVFPIDNFGQGGIMIRESLEPDSPFAALMVTSAAGARGTNSEEYSVYPYFRSLKGGATKTDGDPEPGGLTDDHTGPIRLERFGNTIYYYTTNVDDEKVLIRSEVVPLPDTVLVGFTAYAGSSDALGLYEFTDVVVEEYPLQVMRDIPTDTYEPGADISPITLTASVRSGEVANATIEEVIPLGAIASNAEVSDGELTVNDDGTMTWILTDLSDEATLTYDLSMGTTGGKTWQGTFTDGENPESYIGGDAVLPKNPTFNPPSEPIEIDNHFTTIFQVENGEPWDDLSEGYWGLMLDPRTINGVTVMTMQGGASNVIEFPVILPEDNTYYFFASVRGEDGNSDSFHFEVDALPAGDNSTRWDIGGGNEYGLDWVSSNDPNLNPRPFELTAGEHSILLAAREDDASIDWLAMTTDPGLDINNFVPLEQFIAVHRDLPDIEVGVPDELTAELEVFVKHGNTVDVVVEEELMEGVEVTDLNPSAGNAEVVDGDIVWTLDGVSSNATLEYTATLPDTKVVVFSGTANDTSNRYTVDIMGDQIVPSEVDFEFLTEPIEVGQETVFFQAETPHSANGDFVVKPDPTIFSLLFVEAESSGTSGGVMDDQELTFDLNILEEGTYYLFANARGPDSGSDSFYIGFDIDFDGMEESDDYGYSISNEGLWERRWVQNFDPGGRFWDTTGEPRPYELSSGVHTLHWHARESSAKIDWIAITSDPTIDIDEISEPGEPVSVSDYMLY